MAKKVVIEDFSERKIKGKRAVIYARYSSAKQNEMSIEQQIGECGQYIEKQGYDGPLYFYSDMAKSASKDVEKRVEFLQMLEDAKNNKFDVVVAYAVDRISRDEDDAYYDYENELKKCGEIICLFQNRQSLFTEFIRAALSLSWARTFSTGRSLSFLKAPER